MCTTVAWLQETLANWRWPEIFTAVGTVALAVFAYLALAAWKKQESAKRETDFLSELLDASHSFIAEMSKPIMAARFIKIGMESHIPAGQVADREVVDAIAYIQSRGQDESKRLVSILEPIQSITVRIQSLIAKGQVFHFDGYLKCYNAAKNLAWHFGRLEALAAMISDGNLNWANPEVDRLLRAVMAISPDDMEQQLKNENVVILEFVRNTYQRIYGNKS
jgi:hypothetical protein